MNEELKVFQAKFDKFYESLGDFVDAYEKNNPEWFQITASQIIYRAIINLKALIESPKEVNISWDQPFVELAYPLDVNWDKMEPTLFTVDSSTLDDPEKRPLLFADSFIKIKEAFVMRAFTRDVLFIKRGEKYFFKLPQKLEDELAALPKKKAIKLTSDMAEPDPIRLYIVDESFRDEKQKPRKVRITFSLQFNPFVIDEEKRRGYYPIVVGFETSGYKPQYWSKATRERMWKALLKSLKDNFPKEVLDFKAGPPTEPEIRPVKEKARINYPIVKMDRTTERDLLPILLHRGIFKGSSALPTQEEVLATERNRLKKEKLSFDEERDALKKVGQYKSGNYVVRDYGDHAIGFSCQLYLDYIQHAEEVLKEAQQQPFLYPATNKKIEEGLKRVRLYRLAHRLARLTLAQVYEQRRSRGLEIPKSLIVEMLGYKPEEKQIYQDIKESYETLMLCSYHRWDYAYTETQKARKRRVSSARDHTIGTFIYNLKDGPKSFTLDVNEKFVGCVGLLISDTVVPKKDRKKIFGRTYYDYPTRALTLAKNYSDAAELLTNFLISEMGNEKLRRPGVKVVAFPVSRYIKTMNIKHSRPDAQYRTFLSALKEVEIIEKLSPSLKALENMKPSRAHDAILHVHLKSSPRELDELISMKILEKR